MPYERKTSDILISDELRTMLSEIESQSLVAQLLLKKRHAKEELAEDHVNWISVSTQDKSKISYLTSERAAQMDESEVWTSSKRFHAKPGGFIAKVFKNIPGKEVEIFSTLFRNLACRPQFSLRVVRGSEIRDLYHYESYESDCGSLGASCMRYDSCRDFMDIYVDNKDVVSMLAMENERGGLIGRALLWDFDGNKIMDRIYTTNDEKYAFYFNEWASKNGYLFKSAQNWFDTMSFEKIGDKKQKLKLEVKLARFDYWKYPYMDTFKFYSPSKGTFSNFQPEGSFYTVCAPDGSRYGSDYLVLDKIDDVFRYRHDAVYVRSLDGYTSPNNAYYSEIMDDYILCQDAFYDEEIGEYVYRDDERNSPRVAERREEAARYKARRAEERKLREEAKAAREANCAERTEVPGSIDIETEDLASLIGSYDSLFAGEGELNSLFERILSSTGIPRERFAARRSRRRSAQPDAEASREPEPETEP